MVPNPIGRVVASDLLKLRTTGDLTPTNGRRNNCALVSPYDRIKTCKFQVVY